MPVQETAISGMAALAVVGALVGLAVVAGAVILWLTGRGEPPRRED
jgi:hypothetical protein